MKKQVFYPKFIPRIFSTAIDMCILTVASSPLMRIIQQRFFVWKFKPYLTSHGIDVSNTDAMYNAFNSPDFQPYMTLSNLVSYAALVFFMQAILIGTYFVYFWSQKGWTPGKYLTGMRVLDYITHDKITIWQGIKRFAGALFPISLLLVFFSEQGRSLHDRIAGTIVIKR